MANRKKSKPSEAKSLAPRAETRAARTLPAAEHAVFTEALARAESVRQTVESTQVEYGRWLFSHVFGDDSGSVIDHREDNAIWNELRESADSAHLRLPAAELEDAVLCAAYDKRLSSDAWRALDYGRKRRLLKLGDDRLLRKGAQHALASNLTTRQVEQYVRNVLIELGEEIPTRINVASFRSQLDKLSDRVAAKSFGRQLESAAKKLSDEQRETLVASISAARTALDQLETRLTKG